MSDLLWRGTVEKMLEFSWASTWATLKTDLQLPANACHSLWLLPHRTATAGVIPSLCVSLYFPERLSPVPPFPPFSWGTHVIQTFVLFVFQLEGSQRHRLRRRQYYTQMRSITLGLRAHFKSWLCPWFRDLNFLGHRLLTSSMTKTVTCLM